jgi:glucose-1-phosphatase
MAPLRNLVFDLGGVLYAIDPPRTEHALADLRRPDAGPPARAAAQDLFDRLELGVISPPDFRVALRQTLDLQAGDGELDAAWNALLLGVLPDRVADLSRWRQRYRLILLSNTNAIHQDQIREECGPLFGCFERLFFSQDMRMRKPDPEIYRQALQLAGMRPEESLFVDDVLQNVLGARQAGLQGFHFSPTTGADWADLRRLLDAGATV